MSWHLLMVVDLMRQSKIIAFVGGTWIASGTGVEPHVLLEVEGEDIVAFTDPLSL